MPKHVYFKSACGFFSWSVIVNQYGEPTCLRTHRVSNDENNGQNNLKDFGILKISQIFYWSFRFFVLFWKIFKALWEGYLRLSALCFDVDRLLNFVSEPTYLFYPFQLNEEEYDEVYLDHHVGADANSACIHGILICSQQIRDYPFWSICARNEILRQK